MKLWLGLLLVSCLVVPCAYGEEEITPVASTAVAPELIPLEPAGTATCAPTRWPDFYKWDAGNRCGPIVDEMYSLKRIAPAGTPKEGYFGYFDEDLTTHEPETTEYLDTTGLSTTISFSQRDLSDYRTSAKVIVNWTIRIVGAINPQELKRKHVPWFCPGWTGKSYQKFPSGDVYTQLFVNGKAVGSPAVMTIPSAGEAVTSYRAVDPNITGSVVLTPDDFIGGEFPDELAISVRWYNDTSMWAKGEDKNLIITIMPTL
ncbi:MAG: hypothetical protein WCY34_06765 [Candidatus Omnitrophota bacterium]